MSNALPPMTATVATGPPNSRSYPQTPGSSQQRNYATATSASAAQEHKKLFAAGARRNPAMRGNSLSGKGKGKRVPTCTLKFFCLSRVDASKPPVAIRDRTILFKAGLGDASIQFKMDASSLECHQEIVAKFPKLLETGYELLLYQRGEDAGFYNIPSPYSAQRMKDAAGNAKIYVRPLQKDLDESPVEEQSSLCAVKTLKRFVSNPCYHPVFPVLVFKFIYLLDGILIVH